MITVIDYERQIAGHLISWPRHNLFHMSSHEYRKLPPQRQIEPSPCSLFLPRTKKMYCNKFRLTVFIGFLQPMAPVWILHCKYLQNGKRYGDDSLYVWRYQCLIGNISNHWMHFCLYISHHISHVLWFTN